MPCRLRSAGRKNPQIYRKGLAKFPKTIVGRSSFRLIAGRAPLVCKFGIFEDRHN
jgi:hypothetical protein